MTQMNGKAGPGLTSATPAVAAALHRQGGKWRLVVVANRTGVSLVEARTLENQSGLAELLTQHKVTRLVRVAPAGETVARCASVPAGTSDELGAAASLLAEAQLPESIAAHRRAAGIVPNGEATGGRMALLVGWQGDAEKPLSEEIEETWTTPAAALSTLRQGKGASAVYADAGEGSMSMLVFGDSKSVARVLVEEAPTANAFARAVTGVVGETCSAVGAPSPGTPMNSYGVVLSLDPGSMSAVSSAVQGVPDQKQWFDQYGIALGAAMIALSKDPLVRPLATMLSSAPVKRQAPPERVVTWLSRPRNAWGLLAAAIVLVLLGPLVVAQARLAILQGKSRGLGDIKQERVESARRLAMYAQFERQNSRWPMTKLLADISAAIPREVTADSIRLGTDQGLAISGTAKTSDKLDEMLTNLNRTKLLGNVKLNRVEASSSGQEFELTADVLNPYAKATGLDDYGAKPLAEWLYGPGASNTATPINKSTREASSPVRDSPRAAARANDRPERADRADRGNGDRGERSGSRSSEAPSRPSSSTSASADPPPPLSDDDIKKMDKPTAMKAWVERVNYPKVHSNLDGTTKARLDEEAQKLKEQFQKGGASK